MPEQLEPITLNERQLCELIMGRKIEVKAIGIEQSIEVPIVINVDDIGIERIKIFVESLHKLQKPHIEA